MLSDICGKRRAKHETKSDFLRWSSCTHPKYLRVQNRLQQPRIVVVDSPTYEVGGFANVLDQFVYVNTFWVILGVFFKAEHVVKIFEGRLTQQPPFVALDKICSSKLTAVLFSEARDKVHGQISEFRATVYFKYHFFVYLTKIRLYSYCNMDSYFAPALP